MSTDPVAKTLTLLAGRSGRRGLTDDVRVPDSPPRGRDYSSPSSKLCDSSTTFSSAFRCVSTAFRPWISGATWNSPTRLNSSCSRGSGGLTNTGRPFTHTQPGPPSMIPLRIRKSGRKCGALVFVVEPDVQDGFARLEAQLDHAGADVREDQLHLLHGRLRTHR